MRLTLDQMLTAQKNASQKLQSLSQERPCGTIFLQQDAQRRILNEMTSSINAARANSRPSIPMNRCGHYD